MARDLRDARELLPAPAAVEAAIEACRLRTGELRVQEANADAVRPAWMRLQVSPPSALRNRPSP